MTSQAHVFDNIISADVTGSSSSGIGDSSFSPGRKASSRSPEKRRSLNPDLKKSIEKLKDVRILYNYYYKEKNI